MNRSFFEKEIFVITTSHNATSGSESTSSQQLFERSLKVSPGGVHSPVRAFKSVGGTPIFFKSAEGAHLISVENRRYIDFCQSFGPLLLGHRDPEVAAVVRETTELAWTFGACEPYSLELAEWITSRIKSVEKVRFVSSGTEAVMSALRVARAATGRNKILKFEGCYHGHVDSLLVKAGSGLAGESASDSAGVSAALAHETVVAPLDDEAAFTEIFNLHKDDLAAVIIEPLPANYGLLIQRREFIERVAEIAKQNKTLLIFDEVISGFRVALGGMAEILGMKPDLITYGKVIGGGFPVGCYGGRRELMDLVAPQGPVYQAGTLSANPFGMRAGLATLQKAVRENVYGALEARTRRFTDELSAEFRRKGIPLEICRQGSIFWVHEATGQPIRRLSQIPAKHGEKFKALFHACADGGVYLAPSGYEVSFIGLAHTDSILEDALKRILKAAEASYA
jgi:glutamate-1-semialdehyde 2,1-aminomutase